MLAKLSMRNAKRQAGDYLVYFITIVLAAALIFAFNALVVSSEIRTLSTYMDSLTLIVGMASVVVVIILGWLVYYTQRFMLAKRSRELATYILLGVENKRVAGMFLTENLVVGAAALLLGLIGGNFIYQALRAVVFSLFDLPYIFSFGFYPAAVGLTAAYFAAIFLISLLLCRRRIRKLSIRALIEMDRINEGEVLDKRKPRKKIFTASIVCGITGTALLLTRNLGLGILGSFLIILFCYGFFISFSSGVPSFFDKRPVQKYKGGTLLIFRSLSTKLASIGITMGTIALLFTAALLTEGAALLFQNQFNQNETLMTGFDLYIAAPAGNADMTAYEEYIDENMEITSQLRYTTYNAKDDTVTQYVKSRTDYWTYFDYDQLMGYSDYAALRAMLGYEPAAMSENEYIVHCMDHLKPALDGYNDKLVAGGIELTQGGMYNEVLTQFTWDGNGRGFILVVPDRAVDGQTASLDIWAMMTAQPVDGKVYQGIQDLRDERSNLSGDPDIYDTLMSKAGLKEEYASLSALVVFPLFYLALVLIMAAATILTIQFLSDAGKYRRQFQILYDLGMDKREIRGTLNRQFAIFYGMPVLPPMLICIVFMFALGQAFDAGIIISAAHLWGIIGFSLFLFFAIYLLYVAAASHSMKKAVLPD